jgi:ABC-type nitrate/sulfonate/bicarbonate transport system substrate-binding protein
MAALTSGQTTIADITGSVIASADAGGADVVAFATLDPVYPYVLEVDKTVASAADLKGKRIAVRSFGDATDVAARVALKQLGLAPDKDVEIVEVNSENARVATALTGRACCTVSQPRERGDLEASGFHQLLDFSSLGLANAQGVLSAQRSWLTANRDLAQRFVDSVIEAIAAEKQDKPGSIALIKKYLKVEDAAAGADYDYFVGNVIPARPVVSADQFADGIAILAAKNDKLRDFDMTKYIDQSFLTKR